MTRQRKLAKRRERPTTNRDDHHGDSAAMACRESSAKVAPCVADGANEVPAQEVADDPRVLHGGRGQGDRRPNRSQTLLRLLEQAREHRGSPSLWDAVVARLDAEDRRRDAVAPMSELLHQIQQRVDDETWRLVLDLELRFSSEVVAGVEVGMELGYEHGRAAVLLDAERVPGSAAKALTGRLADLLGDTEADYLDVILALLATLDATVKMARGGSIGCKLGLADAPRPSLP